MQTALARSPERRPFPLPQDIAGEVVRSTVRACTAAVLNPIRYPNAGRGEKILVETWPSDHRAMAILTRAATAPATTTTTGWAAELAVTTTVGAFLSSLPQSAASRLFAAGLQLPLSGAAQVKVPYQAATPSLAPSFVAEGAPIPVRQPALTTVTIGPRKMAVLTALTNEIAEHSTPVAEQIVRQILIESASRALDQAVFSSAAGDTTRPPGILNGVTPLTATTGGGQAALIGDIGLLVGALTAAGATRAMLFVPPAKAAIIPVYAPGNAVEVVPTPALAPATVVAIDPAGIVSGSGTDQPRIDVARGTTLHFEDTTPLQIGTPGAPPVVAAPTRSAFQTDIFALRLLLVCAWGARPGFVQLINSVTW